MNNSYFDKERLENTSFSIFKKPISNCVDCDDANIFDIHDLIKDCYENATLTLRSLPDNGDYKKNNFHAVTFSGTFSERKNECLIAHSNLVCIDIDHLPAEKFNRIKNLVKHDPHLIMVFVSPSGNGLKAIYPINLTMGTHEEWYKAYMKHVADTCYVDESYIDKSCINISRACFISHDPEVFLNPEINQGGKIFPIDIVEKENPQISDGYYEGYSLESSSDIIIDFNDKDSEANFLALIKLTERRKGPYQSPREPWIQSLACRCNVLGMSKEKCLQYTLKHFEHHAESINPAKPINIKNYLEHPVNDTYVRYKANFSTWVDDSVQITDEPNTKSFAPEIFNNLPTFIKNLCDPFDGRERDVFFMGVLGALSACFPNVRGVYDGSSIGTNLFVFIAAPASAGKGSMKWARNLIKPIHTELRVNSEIAIKWYKKNLEDWKADKSLTHPGDKPKPQSLIIPGNISGTGILQTVADNDGIGLIFETEADTLSGALGQDWGNFSDFLRKAFHHETISYKRRAGDEYVEVDNPSFSVVLSGTPMQINNLIPNTENGLFSRFCFYSFNSESKFKNVFEKKAIGSFEDFIENQTKDLNKYFGWIREEPSIKFSLASDQEDYFVESFSKYHNEFTLLFGADINASVRRLGVITFRIAMILSIFRKLEDGMVMDFINCKDVDFYNALAIVDVLIDHTAQIYQSLNKNGMVDLKPRPLAYYKLLPASFDRQEAIRLADTIDIIPKTAESYLAKFINKNYLQRPEHNHYLKPNF